MLEGVLQGRGSVPAPPYFKVVNGLLYRVCVCQGVPADQLLLPPGLPQQGAVSRPYPPARGAPGHGEDIRATAGPVLLARHKTGRRGLLPLLRRVSAPQPQEHGTQPLDTPPR